MCDLAFSFHGIWASIDFESARIVWHLVAATCGDF